jgi:serine/threonine protein phosphatase PrpC
MMKQQNNAMELEQHRLTPTTEVGLVASALQIDVAALSDIGYRRTNNEDSFGYDREMNVFIVCDGMGGLAAGEVASRTTVEVTLRKYKELYSDQNIPERYLDAAIAAANDTVWKMAQQDLQLRGMGTTLVVACINQNRLVIGNVGDSRAYLLRAGDCVQITEDHSYLAEQIRRGGGLLANVLSARLQQLITRAVGTEADVKPDFFTSLLKPGDVVLLATDGLTRYADADKLAEHIDTYADLEDTCEKLIGIAHKAGAEDNVTCLLLRVS